MAKYYIVDVRKEWRGDPYITLWRPKASGYAYPLPWAGQYTRDEIESEPDYYHNLRYGTKRTLNRFPVRCDIVEKYAVEPARGRIDGDVGPVIPNKTDIRQALRKARLILQPSSERKAG